MKIFNFGSLNIDKVYSVKEFVQGGQTISATDLQTYPGGKGLNQSIAAAKAGAYVVQVGCVGNDGEMLRQYLLSNYVHCDFLKVVDGPSGHAVIQVDPKGQNCIITYPGANCRMEKEYIDRVFEEIEKEDIVLLQNEINLVDYIMEKGAEKGARIVFNPSPITESMLKAPLHLVNTFILNYDEACYLSGETELLKILEVLEGKYPGSEIILTLGDKGSIYRYKGKERSFDIFKTKAVDTTGAGDTYCGYFLACSIQGMDTKEALTYASAAAAVAVSRKGAASSIPGMDEVNRFIKEYER